MGTVKNEKVLRKIEMYSFVFLIILLISISIIKFRGTSGMAIEQDSDSFVENFNLQIDGNWDSTNVQDRTISESHLDTEFIGKELTADSNLKIPYSNLKLNMDSSIIWLRIKLDNDNYDQSEFLPFFSIGSFLLFKGSAIEGENTQADPLPAPGNGNNIYFGSPGYYKEIGTWEKGQWHEIMVYWHYESESSCNLVELYIDNVMIPAPTGCDENCDMYTLGYCDDDNEDFPINTGSYLQLMPPLSDIETALETEHRSGVNLHASSGFFIDKLITKKESIDSFMGLLEDETMIISPTPYWSRSEIESVSLDKGVTTDTIVIENLVEKCRLWNQPGENGAISLGDQYFQGAEILKIENNNLIIDQIEPDLETRGSAEIICSDGTAEDIKEVDITIGDPKIFEFYFRTTNNDEIDINLNKNSEQIVEYFVKNIDRDSISLTHDVTGESIVQEEHYPEIDKGDGFHKVRIISGSQTGTEIFTLTITNDNTGEYTTGEIHVAVIGDNKPPDVTIISPQGNNLEINLTESIRFKIEASDDRGARLQYSWYVNGTWKDQTQNYTFRKNNADDIGTYRITLKVSDGEFETTKNWNVEVVVSQQGTDSSTNDDTGTDGTITAVCGNNVLEEGEECDGSQKIAACYGIQCRQDCTCTAQTQGDNPNQDMQNDPNQGSGNTQTSANEGDQGSSSTSTQTQPNTNQKQTENGLISEGDTTKNGKTTPQTNTGKTAKQSLNDFEKKSPKDTLFTALLWILMGLCIVPFILIGSAKLSKMKSETKPTELPEGTSNTHQKLIDTVQWYKNKGMPANSAYKMLLRMGFNEQQVYNAIYQIFNLKK